MKLFAIALLLAPFLLAIVPLAAAERTCGGLDVPCQIVCGQVFGQAPTDSTGAPSCVEDHVLDPTTAHNVHGATQCVTDNLDGTEC